MLGGPARAASGQLWVAGGGSAAAQQRLAASGTALLEIEAVLEEVDARRRQRASYRAFLDPHTAVTAAAAAEAAAQEASAAEAAADGRWSVRAPEAALRGSGDPPDLMAAEAAAAAEAAVAEAELAEAQRALRLLLAQPAAPPPPLPPRAELRGWGLPLRRWATPAAASVPWEQPPPEPPLPPEPPEPPPPPPPEPPWPPEPPPAAPQQRDAAGWTVPPW